MQGKKLYQNIAGRLSEKLEKEVLFQKSDPVGGGCINNTEKIETSSGNFFLKYNDAKQFPGMFDAEAKGLKLLREANEIFVPEVICLGEERDESFLVLELVRSGRRQRNFFEDFGKRLAKLHKHTSGGFGLDHDNYIGSLPQRNWPHDNWVDFFVEERLEQQIKLACDSNVLSRSFIPQFNNLFRRLNEIFPDEKPALVHGDLWSGNFMTAPDGFACIIDPAVYFGFREMDIAMSKLFGGFPAEFYDSYNSEFPMEKGWQLRADICNLYPLMVHVNLFGGGYVYDVQSILKRF